jgi:hypothetical protein
MKSERLLRFCTGLLFLFFTCCQQQKPVPIQFEVSQGVMNAMDFAPLGVQKGDSIDSLRLFTLEGDSTYLHFSHQENPKLLISGSYTCDVTRGNMHFIDSLYREFGDWVDIYVVNTIEAHPDDSPSPYSADPQVWLAHANLRDSISAPQPKTMEERTLLAERWINESGMQPPILLDGPQNEFWNFAGQAPNMSVLVNDGVVILKQSWFDYEEIKATLADGW